MEKELRLALVCYGGVSLAVYMHGITREVWHLARTSRAHHSGEEPGSGSESVYAELLQLGADKGGAEVRVLVDILAGASAGGINAIFLAEAISTGSSLEPLTDLWLDEADVDRLLDPEVSRISRFAKNAAIPFAWMLSRRGGAAVDEEENDALKAELRAKVANFIRARWFAPPFAGPGFTNILLTAINAMKAGTSGRPLLPPGHPLDLSVTVTDFRGHPQKLRLNSPPEVLETEHRVTLSFRDEGGAVRRIGEVPDLAFAARATASFPGAFPPFTVAELDGVLAERQEAWPGRGDFLERVLPRHSAAEAEKAVLIDGSILENAPFGPAIAALQNRPSRREVDRRFVYIDPKPGLPTVRLGGGGEEDIPGFFATIFGAISDIPREQPIRDDLAAIEIRSARIRRLNRIVAAIRPQVETAVRRAFGWGFFLFRPTPARMAAWRTRARRLAARESGFAYAAYGHLKMSRVVENAIQQICRLGGGDTESAIRSAVWATLRASGVAAEDSFTPRGVGPDAVAFLKRFDTGYRVRRLRLLRRQLLAEAPEHKLLRDTINDLTTRYRAAALQGCGVNRDSFVNAASAPDIALAALAERLDLRALDAEADARLSEALAALPRAERKALIVSYLGFAFYDIATYPLLQDDGRDEFDPIKVDRISPDDAVAIRAGTAATLKGIQFSSFGAFFSRAYRENDYLWGRLHGADRLVDIVLSTFPQREAIGENEVKDLKRNAFRAILQEERGRLTNIDSLFEELEREIG